MQIERILVTPRWSGTIDDDWYPWLATQLPALERIPLPDPGAPVPATCAVQLAAALDAGDPARTLVIGHSVSCQGWLHALARGSGPVAGFLAIAGWWTVDRPWPTIVPWCEATLDHGALRARLGRVHVVLGTDDPFTRDQEANAERWRGRLGATVDIVEDGRHFNRPIEPAVLAAIRTLVAA
jgi:predicted alpha/beta hydrolase family esterase